MTEPYLHAQTKEGLRWSYGSAVLVRALNPVTTLFLAALIHPQAFGEVSIVVGINGLLLLVSRLGLDEALMRDARSAHALVQHIFRLKLAIGCGAYLLVWFTAPAIAALYREPALVPLSHVLGLVFLTDPLSSTSESVMSRNLHFRRQFWYDASGSVGFATAGVLLGLLGAGVWALVGATISSAAVRAITGCILGGWFPHVRRLPPRTIHDSVRFGAFVATQNVLGWAGGAGPPLIIGALVGIHAAALYSMAITFAGWPSSLVTAPLGRLFLPIMARAQRAGHDVMVRYYQTTLKWVALLAFPCVAVVAAVAPTIVRWLGPSWDGLLPVYYLLLPYSVSSTVLTVNDQVFKAINKVAVYTRFYALQTITVITLLAASAWATRQLVPAVAAQAAAYVGFYVWNFTLLSRLVGVSLRSIGRILLYPAPVVVGIVAAGWIWATFAAPRLPRLADTAGLGVLLVAGSLAGCFLSPVRRELKIAFAFVAATPRQIIAAFRRQTDV
ncbi:MAG: oligosaccharide flippase family protein [Thermoplasmatota archaeon]